MVTPRVPFWLNWTLAYWHEWRAVVWNARARQAAVELCWTGARDSGAGAEGRLKRAEVMSEWHAYKHRECCDYLYEPEAIQFDVAFDRTGP